MLYPVLKTRATGLTASPSDTVAAWRPCSTLEKVGAMWWSTATTTWSHRLGARHRAHRGGEGEGLKHPISACMTRRRDLRRADRVRGLAVERMTIGASAPAGDEPTPHGIVSIGDLVKTKSPKRGRSRWMKAYTRGVGAA